MDSNDPHFKYRDALLEHLLKLESERPIDELLRIQYRQVVSHEISIVALELAGALGDGKRLLQNGVRALRKDGILFLLCPESDTYLLVSVDRVLKPYLRKVLSREQEGAMERAALKLNRPEYLACVPKARVDLVKRRLLLEQQDQPLAP